MATDSIRPTPRPDDLALLADFEARLAELIALEPAMTAANERLMAIGYVGSDYLRDTLWFGFTPPTDTGSPVAIHGALRDLRRYQGSPTLEAMDEAGWLTAK
jgi:hypothetical protein